MSRTIIINVAFPIIFENLNVRNQLQARYRAYGLNIFYYTNVATTYEVLNNNNIHIYISKYKNIQLCSSLLMEGT